MDVITLPRQALDAETTVRKAIAFPMDSVLSRYAKDEGLPMDVVLEHEREAKRFLILCALYPGNKLGMKGPIDKFWHTFIIFTKEYAEFCHKVAGRFIHHNPTLEEDRKSVKSLQSYELTLSLYREHFGEPETHFWPPIQRVIEGDLKCTVDCKDDCKNCSDNSCTNCNHW